MWDGFNKRKFPRVNLSCEITIKAHEGKSPMRAITENLGAGGVCVILDKPLERFSVCHVSLDLADASPKIECAGKAVWIVPTQEGSKKRFDTGIEFSGLDEAAQDRIRKYLQKNGH